MPTITLRKHSRGINRAVQPFELEDGQYVELLNLLPTEEALAVRPGRTRYLTQISATLPATGIARLYGLGGTEGSADAPGAQGPRNPGTVANDPSFGTVAWTSPDGAREAGGGYAEARALDQSTWSTQYLKLTNFGFAIPSGAVIRGIKVEVRRRHLSGDAVDARVRLVRAGAVESTDRARTTEFWPGDFIRYDTYGGEEDLWGASWTPADINHSGFGVALAATLRGSPRLEAEGIAHIDHVRITVYYGVTTGQAGGGKETLVQVGTTLYTDKSGSWAALSGFTPAAEANLQVVVWKGKAYIQDGVNSPVVYNGTAISPWTGAPVAKFMLFDAERIYLFYADGSPNKIRACNRDDPDTWPAVTKPTGDEGFVAYVGRGDGDYITGAAKLGSTKFIFKSRATWRLLGDDAETWALDQIFPVGCIAPRTIANCGNELVWCDGRRVYAFNGMALDMDFGQPIEPLLEETPIEEWPNRCAVFWDGLYILWYSATRAVVFDFRTRAWYGPWEVLPARAAVVDRDENRVWVASAVAGEVWRLVGTTDDGVAIPWRAESKHYDFGTDFVKRPRRAFVTADGRVGTISMTLLTSGQGNRSLTRALAFAGAQVVTVKANLSQGVDGVYVGLRLEGSGSGGKVYEYGMTAEPLRRR